MRAVSRSFSAFVFFFPLKSLELSRGFLRGEKKSVSIRFLRVSRNLYGVTKKRVSELRVIFRLPRKWLSRGFSTNQLEWILGVFFTSVFELAKWVTRGSYFKVTLKIVF